MSKKNIQGITTVHKVGYITNGRFHVWYFFE